MNLRSQKGFTLIEVIVVAAIIAVLAGILVPMIFKEVDESKIARAQADTKAVLSAVQVFRKDVGQWPVLDGNNACAANLSVLYGSGNVPTSFDASWVTATPGTMNAQLRDNNACYGAKWKGPYIARVNEDPWGNSYVINADSFNVAGAGVWLLSAGPDGVINTPVASNTPAGDDVGVRIK